MTSDDARSSGRDLTASQTAPGIGSWPSFMCGACGRRRSIGGRRMQRVAGLRTWVCAACAATDKNGRSAPA